MPDELQHAISIEEPFPGDEPTAPELEAAVDDDAEPEGAIEVQPGRRMVDVSVVSAERKRAREATEKRVRDAEVAPLNEKLKELDALKQAVNELRPYADFIKQNPHVLQQQQPKQAETDDIPDEQAATYARRYELFDPTSGQPDIKRAKAIMADNRREQAAIAQQAAQEAVGPLRQQTAVSAQRENFIQAIKRVEGDEIVTPEIIAQQFAELGPEMTQHPEVAQVALERAIGRAYLQRRGSGKPAAPRAPVISEQAGGRASTPVSLTESGKKLGLSESDLKSANKTYTPGGVSEIGSW